MILSALHLQGRFCFSESISVLTKGCVLMDRNHDENKKTIDRKLRILYVMDYMRQHSDEDHPVRLDDIKKAITDRGIYTTRKALYDDFEVLSDYGFEIIRVDGTYKYYYSNPLFEFAELKLMIDIMHASRFVSEKKKPLP